MKPCARCGADRWQPVHEAYDLEVRRPDPDLELLETLAPPTRRASIHGFVLAVLVWILFLLPFFEADHGRPFRGTASAALLVALWIPLFLHARKQDGIRLAAYRKQMRCSACGALNLGEG